MNSLIKRVDNYYNEYELTCLREIVILFRKIVIGMLDYQKKGSGRVSIIVIKFQLIDTL